MNVRHLALAVLFFIRLFYIDTVNAQIDSNPSSQVEADSARGAAIMNRVHMKLLFNQIDGVLEELEEAKAIFSDIWGSESWYIGYIWETIGWVQYSQLDFEKAKIAYQKALNIRLMYVEEEHPYIAEYYGNLGVIYSRLGQLLLAKEYGEKAIAIERALMQKYSPEQLKKKFKLSDDYILNPVVTYRNLADIYNAIGDYRQALDYLQTAKKLIDSLGGIMSSELPAIYNNAGNTFFGRGDYKRAIDYYEQADRLSLKKTPESATFLGNLSSCYAMIGNLDKSFELAEQAVKIGSKLLGERHPYTVGLSYNLGMLYIRNENLEKAKQQLDIVLQLQLEILGAEHPHLGNTYSGLGHYYYLKGDFKNAIEYNNKGIEIYRNAVGDQHPYLGEAYRNQAIFYRATNAYAKADETLQKALNALNYSPSYSLDSVNAPSVLFKTLNTVGVLYRDWFQAEGNLEHLIQSREVFIQAITVLEYHIKLLNPSSKLSLAPKVHDFFANAVATNMLLAKHDKERDNLFYLKESFIFSERAKAFTLYQAFQESKARKIAGIPDSLLEREYSLQVEISMYEKMLQIEEVMTESDRSHLFELKRELDQLKNYFEQSFPAYYQLKYDLSVIDVEHVQHNILDSKQSLLEYMISDSTIYVFLVQSDNFEVFEMPYDFSMEEWGKQMIQEGILGYSTQSSQKKTSQWLHIYTINYIKAAYFLYQKLIEPLADKIDSSVIIIPDGIMATIPFEALLKELPPRNMEGRYGAYKFFVKNHSVSYCFSATLLREMRGRVNNHLLSGELLAMAPFSERNGTVAKSQKQTYLPLKTEEKVKDKDFWHPLPYSREEVAQISELWTGMTLFNENASAEKFKNLAPSYRLIHLATHAEADTSFGDYSYLVFANSENPDMDEKLYASDLYNISLNAELVSLSACETGIGSLQRGEGLIGLTRAFSYAGANNLVATLWQAHDEKTKDLMVGFYRHLKRGKTKNEALQLAKLEYLQQQIGENLHPYYWAGVIGIGDMDKLSTY